MDKERIKKEVSDWFYKKHYYCKDVDSMLTFTAKSVIDEIVEFTEQQVKNNCVLDDVIKCDYCGENFYEEHEPKKYACNSCTHEM